MSAKAETTIVDGPSAPGRACLRIVCGIDASRTDATAVQEACTLAGDLGHVALVCVVDASGVGANAQATITPARATAALGRAMKQAHGAGVRSSAYLLQHPHASRALLQAAADGDLLVVGSHGHTRAGGIALGGVATGAVHDARVPVLIARPAPPQSERSILIASDGSPGSLAACELGAKIAALTGSSVTLFTAEHDTEAEFRHMLASQAVEIYEATGREPTVIFGRGKPADAILDAAQACRCSLLVVGSSGRKGLRALGSVSERVAHQARCSVLVARPKRG